MIDKKYTKIKGLWGECCVARKLKLLPKDYFVIRNIKLRDDDGNIDFVLACQFGIFAIEVKTAYHFDNKAKIKCRAKELKDYLVKKGIQVDYVKPVLVYVKKKRQREDYDYEVEVVNYEDLVVYFEKNMPIRENIKYGIETLNEVYKLLTKNN